MNTRMLRTDAFREKLVRGPSLGDLWLPNENCDASVCDCFGDDDGDVCEALEGSTLVSICEEGNNEMQRE